MVDEQQKILDSLTVSTKYFTIDDSLTVATKYFTIDDSLTVSTKYFTIDDSLAVATKYFTIDGLKKWTELRTLDTTSEKYCQRKRCSSTC